MDKIALIGNRDIPLTTDMLGFMQAAYAALETLGKLAGDNYIVTGCVVTGDSVSSGYVFIKGQLMPFIGGSIQTSVKVVTVVNEITVELGTRTQTSYRAEFGASTTPDENIAWADLLANKNLLGRFADLEYDSGWIDIRLTANVIALPDYLEVRKKGNTVFVRGKLSFENTSSPAANVGDYYTIGQDNPWPPDVDMPAAATGYGDGQYAIKVSKNGGVLMKWGLLSGSCEDLSFSLSYPV